MPDTPKSPKFGIFGLKSYKKTSTSYSKGSSSYLWG